MAFRRKAGHAICCDNRKGTAGTAVSSSKGGSDVEDEK